MRIHLVAMMMVLTAAVVTGCDSPREVRDTGRAEARGCNHCHGYPPPPSLHAAATHPAVPAASCNVCHPSTVLADGYTIRDPLAGGTHQNGEPNLVEDGETLDCTRCHAAPPSTGLHPFHWSRMVAGNRATCSTCHRGFAVGDDASGTADTSVHMNGEVDVILDRDVDVIIEAADRPDGSWLETSCRPCHDARP